MKKTIIEVAPFVTEETFAARESELAKRREDADAAHAAERGELEAERRLYAERRAPISDAAGKRETIQLAIDAAERHLPHARQQVADAHELLNRQLNSAPSAWPSQILGCAPDLQTNSFALAVVEKWLVAKKAELAEVVEGAKAYAVQTGLEDFAREQGFSL